MKILKMIGELLSTATIPLLNTLFLLIYPTFLQIILCYFEGKFTYFADKKNICKILNTLKFRNIFYKYLGIKNDIKFFLSYTLVKFFCFIYVYLYLFSPEKLPLLSLLKEGESSLGRKKTREL